MAANDSTNRDAFGHWLSGFTDGEGCFLLRLIKGRRHFTGSARFQIGLRRDDSEILHQIREFWNIGNTSYYQNKHHGKGGGEINVCKFTVDALSDVLSVVIPHFERYPLRAKKQRDFIIWKQGAEICQRVLSKPTNGRIGHHGPVRRWTKHDLDEFETLRDLIRAQRQYNAPP